MKQTAVEWLEDCLTEKHSNGSFVWNTRADLEALFKQAKKLEKQKMIEMHDKGFDSVEQLNDEFAIEFAEFCSKYRDKNRNIYGEMLHATSKYDDTYTTKELLEIYKKEKEL